MTTRYFVENVGRVMQVLDLFASDGGELRLTDLSERLGISKPQVLRIVSTLEQGGYLTRDPDTKRYRLGLRLFMLGMVVQQQMDLRRAAQPVLNRLALESEETVGLFVPEHLGPICVDVIDSPHGLRIFAQHGRRMPWNAGSSAKVILAFLPEDKREEVLAKTQFKKYTERTVTDPDALRDVLARIREDGYHFAEQDLDLGAGGIAAPVFDNSTSIVGAISVAAPVSRLFRRDIQQLVQLVVEACRETSVQLGYSSFSGVSQPTVIESV